MFEWSRRASRSRNGSSIGDTWGRAMSPSGEIDISVVIVNWNTRDLLLSCLRAITSQDLLAFTSEMIVVDNGSTDGSAQAVRETYSGITLIENMYPMGFTKAANQGFMRSQGRYILLVSPDATPRERGAVVTMARTLDRDPQVAMVVPRYVYPDGSFQRMYNGFPTLTSMCLVTSPLLRLRIVRRLPPVKKYFLDDRDFERPGEVPQPGVAFVLIKRKVLETVGMLDEQFPVYFSDVDWCLRLAALGSKILYLPGVLVVHLRGAATGKMGEHQWIHSTASLVRYFRKHKNGVQTRVLQAALVGNLLAEKMLLGFGTMRRGHRIGPRYRLIDIWRAVRGELPPLEVRATSEGVERGSSRREP